MLRQSSSSASIRVSAAAPASAAAWIGVITGYAGIMAVGPPRHVCTNSQGESSSAAAVRATLTCQAARDSGDEQVDQRAAVLTVTDDRANDTRQVPADLPGLLLQFPQAGRGRSSAATSRRSRCSRRDPPQPIRDAQGALQYLANRETGMHALRDLLRERRPGRWHQHQRTRGDLGHGDPGFKLCLYTHMLPSSHEGAPARRSTSDSAGSFHWRLTSTQGTEPEQNADRIGLLPSVSSSEVTSACDHPASRTCRPASAGAPTEQSAVHTLRHGLCYDVRDKVPEAPEWSRWWHSLVVPQPPQHCQVQHACRRKASLRPLGDGPALGVLLLGMRNPVEEPNHARQLVEGLRLVVFLKLRFLAFTHGC